MAVLLSILVSDILPVFLIAGVGFLLARLRDANVETLAHVSFYSLAPCLVFNMLMTSTMTRQEAGRMALLAMLVPISMGVVARLAAIPLRLCRAEMSAFLLVVMFSNAGNYGLPIVLFAFGPEAVAHATVYFVTTSIITYAGGVFVAAAGQLSIRRALLSIMRVPSLYSIAAALLLLGAGISLPVAIMRPVKLLSDASLPIMVLVLGMQLERAKVAARPGVVAGAVGLSLTVAPMIALGLTSFLGLSGPDRQAGVTLASMPVAVVTTIIALEFETAPRFV